MILYKYYPDNVNSFKALSIKGLWCHHVTNMNDPFECLGMIDRNFTKQQIEQFRIFFKGAKQEHLLRLAEETDLRINDFINKQRKLFIEKLAFCSLSESYDDVLMWTHYASEHTGFVIGIEFEDKQMDQHFQKVKYCDKLPDFDLKRLADLMLFGNNSDVSYLLSDISIKSKDWSYEKEWRIWRMKPSYIRYSPDQIKKVYFGLNCKPETKMIISKLTELQQDFKYSEMLFSDFPIGLKNKE